MIAGGDAERRGFALDQLFLQGLAPGVGAEQPRVAGRGAFVLPLPRCARRPQHREAADEDETRHAVRLHRVAADAGCASTVLR